MSVLGLQPHIRPLCSGDTCSKQDVNMISSRLLLPDPLSAQEYLSGDALSVV